jgi:hypothetical protein
LFIELRSFLQNSVAAMKYYNYTLTTVTALCLLETICTLTNAFFIITPRLARIPSLKANNVNSNDDDDSAIQWELFKKHHALGSWRGIWTTYDYIGDIQDETIASVNLNYYLDETTNNQRVDHSHTIVVGAKRSDCATCYDTMETKTFPIATCTPDTILRNMRFGSCGVVTGPTVLKKTGVMATELCLKHGDGRVRVVFQHAPVWQQGVTESGPPHGLKLFRIMVSREALRETAPTAEMEEANPPTSGNPVFNRPVPPFHWHKIWAGTSWTWGPQTGNRGWAVEQLEESDSWHGSAPVSEWNLRLPGGIFIQCPRVITDTEAVLLRIAWLPTDDILLRLEAGVLALQPTMIYDAESVVLAPPTLGSFRCDVLEKMGELQGQPSFVEDSHSAFNNVTKVDTPALNVISPLDTELGAAPKSESPRERNDTKDFPDLHNVSAAALAKKDSKDTERDEG